MREIIRVKSVKSRMLEPGYGYVRITNFQSRTTTDLLKAISDLQKEERLNGLILDLRNNPGGVLNGAVGVSDAFIDEGLIVYTEGRIDDSSHRYLATPGDSLNGVQASLFNSSRGRVEGVQLGLAANISRDDVEGVQVGLGNIADGDLAGLQVGLYNSSGDGTDGLQLGAFNKAGEVEGVQLGLANHAHENNRLQIGLVNVANNRHGWQIGLMNFNLDPVASFPGMIFVNGAF